MGTDQLILPLGEKPQKHEDKEYSLINKRPWCVLCFARDLAVSWQFMVHLSKINWKCIGAVHAHVHTKTQNHL